MKSLIMLYKRELLFVMLFFVVLILLGQAVDVFAWNALVSSADFDGIKTDVTTVGTGIVTVCIIVVGVFLVVKAMSH